MTPETWEQVRRVFHGALEVEPGAREAYVRQQAEDPDVRREVLSLLAAQPEADAARFLSTPTLAPQSAGSIPALSKGVRLGPFEIVELIGAGGMGEVYRASDTRLNRAVAIKVLSPALASNPDGRDRFEREARVVSKLSHPHICTLHDVGAAMVGGAEVRYLVMELIEGETLAARLSRGPLPVEQAIATGMQIVEALAAAHAAGVVHRDLKPANIILTRSGVKLLDFGLARLRRSAVDPAAERSQTITSEGIVVGTVPYMSPEQLKGKEADARSDIFAFGAVLYEMVTGTRAFGADSQAEIVAAILEHQPLPLATRQPLAPRPLERLVSTCLAKAPEDRWQSAHDIALALGDLSTANTIASGANQAVAPRPVIASRWGLHAGWALVALLLAGFSWSFAPAAGGPPLPRNAVPVVVLMDSPLEGRVYDPRTLAAGGTNADDISDALRSLKIVIQKETTSPMWHREEQVRQERPDLIISHLSGFADLRATPLGTDANQTLFNLAMDRLKVFFGYQAAFNPQTRFLVYSRGRQWSTKEGEDAWIGEVVARFPQLKGRLFTMVVPGAEKATFRDPATAKTLLERVTTILQFQ